MNEKVTIKKYYEGDETLDVPIFYCGNYQDFVKDFYPNKTDNPEDEHYLVEIASYTEFLEKSVILMANYGVALEESVELLTGKNKELKDIIKNITDEWTEDVPVLKPMGGKE